MLRELAVKGIDLADVDPASINLKRRPTSTDGGSNILLQLYSGRTAEIAVSGDRSRARATPARARELNRQAVRKSINDFMKDDYFIYRIKDGGTVTVAKKICCGNSRSKESTRPTLIPAPFVLGEIRYPRSERSTSYLIYTPGVLSKFP